MVYGGTVYFHSMCSHFELEKIFIERAVTKKPTSVNRRVVLIAISALYLLAIVNLILEWYFVNWSLVVNGDTRESIFWSSLRGPSWFGSLYSFLLDASLVVSDGLLVGYIY